MSAVEEITVTREDIVQLRTMIELAPTEQASHAEVEKVDAVLAELIATTGDVELAATAIVMRPRPVWVEDLIGEVSLIPGRPL